MRTLLLAVAILVAVPVLGQEAKKPTVAQCQADQAVWLLKLNEGAASSGWANSAKDKSSKTLLDWAEEMLSCQALDPKNLDHYLEATKLVFVIIGARQADFLARHSLAKQFFEEDDAGAR